MICKMLQLMSVLFPDSNIVKSCVRKHEKSCPACAKEAELERKIDGRLKNTKPEMPIPFGLEERILKAVRQSSAASANSGEASVPVPGRGMMLRHPFRVAAPALALMLICTGLFYWRVEVINSRREAAQNLNLLVGTLLSPLESNIASTDGIENTLTSTPEVTVQTLGQEMNNLQKDATRAGEFISKCLFTSTAQ